MANTFTVTNRFKFQIPEEGHTDWEGLLAHWANMMEVMYQVLSNKDFVITGLSIDTSVASLSFTYAAGSVSVGGTTVSLNSGAGSLTADSWNWLYVQNGQIKLSVLPPAGANYIPLYVALTDSTGVIAIGDMRTAAPTLNGVTIAPEQVNPIKDINMRAGMRVLHADAGVGSNIVMFTNSEVQNLVSWGNQTTANDWVTVDSSVILPSIAKFIILNCYIATLNADVTGFATLEVQTNDTDDINRYQYHDYGHGTTQTLNSDQKGIPHQVILPLDTDRKFRARSFINSLGTGTYYAFIDAVGYVA